MAATVDPDLRTTLAAAPLRRDVVVVEGSEAQAFLQGQLSQDLDGMAVGTTVRALLLQPTGKVAAWLRVTHLHEDGFLLDVDPGAGEAVVARLRRFLLRTKAVVTAAAWSGLAVRGPGAAEAAPAAPEGGLVLPSGWPGVDGVDVLAPDGVPSGLPAASAEALDALRIECGVPAMGAEITEATIPAELGRWLVEGSVSFTKGCYTGQELVARVDSRGGNVPRPLRGLVVEGPEVVPPGSAVLAGGTEVGRLTSSARSPELGPVALAPLSRSVEPGTAVEVLAPAGDTVAATVAELPLR